MMNDEIKNMNDRHRLIQHHKLRRQMAILGRRPESARFFDGIQWMLFFVISIKTALSCVYLLIIFTFV